jgi:hypothetical protein
MPISKTFTMAGSTLLVLVFTCHAYLYDAWFHEGARLTTGERRMADNITPAARIRETFALFVPGDAKRTRNDAARLLARAVKPQA